jgi:hypothetical protein
MMGPSQEGKVKNTPWGSSFRAPPEILHGMSARSSQTLRLSAAQISVSSANHAQIRANLFALVCGTDMSANHKKVLFLES